MRGSGLLRIHCGIITARGGKGRRAEPKRQSRAASERLPCPAVTEVGRGEQGRRRGVSRASGEGKATSLCFCCHRSRKTVQAAWTSSRAAQGCGRRLYRKRASASLSDRIRQRICKALGHSFSTASSAAASSLSSSASSSKHAASSYCPARSSSSRRTVKVDASIPLPRGLLDGEDVLGYGPKFGSQGALSVAEVRATRLLGLQPSLGPCFWSARAFFSYGRTCHTPIWAAT
mmetsp:Transcript_36312/g.86217  ORF Transcript_36312/g.86217 Transcript_36312/m.86217 type:complete len:232 (+) Transcript_36312:1414-2109(+)